MPGGRLYLFDLLFNLFFFHLKTCQIFIMFSLSNFLHCCLNELYLFSTYFDADQNFIGQMTRHIFLSQQKFILRFGETSLVFDGAKVIKKTIYLK